jgi:hypothetical protein
MERRGDRGGGRIHEGSGHREGSGGEESGRQESESGLKCVILIVIGRGQVRAEGRAAAHDRPVRRLSGAKWDRRTNMSRINVALFSVLIYGF